ncbi:S8 family peptidase [Endozoicomonas ascidiicola]|uniref:S8 family peptidase n=1 Tax=Endozoicomonas ascidiicola TaxID=1698521 RepID=UPI00082C418F|nr:S8 family peptidase [Endozoicomonas ascidiicola]
MNILGSPCFSIFLLISLLLMDISIAQADSGSFRLNINKIDRIIIHFKENPTRANAIAFIKQGTTEGGFGVASGKRREIFDIGANLDIKDVQILADSLEKDPQVAFAEPDLLMHSMMVPNDPLFNEQWHFFEQRAGINLPAAWDISTGNKDITIGVPDTGFTEHDDINDQLLPGYDFISDPWMANDGDGWDNSPLDTGDSLQPGACGTNNGNPVPTNTRKSSWHGTHVMGTIGASGNNSDGVAGVLWQSSILPLRVLGRCGGYSSDITAAMRWAAGLPVFGLPINKYPVSVLNLSLGGSSLICSQTYQNAINEIVATGVTIVVAAGNSQRNAALTTPANCDNVIVVGAINRLAQRAWYSNYGNNVDIMAPGGETKIQGNGVLSLFNSGLNSTDESSYKELQGTSMATPQVAGLIGLSVGINPDLTPAERETLLKVSARAFPVDSNCTLSRCGAGIVDAAAFLQLVQESLQKVPLQR